MTIFTSSIMIVLIMFTIEEVVITVVNTDLRYDIRSLTGSYIQRNVLGFSFTAGKRLSNIELEKQN